MTNDGEKAQKRTVVIVGSISGSFGRLAAMLPDLMDGQEGKGVEIFIAEPDPVPDCPVIIKMPKTERAKTHPVRVGKGKMRRR